MREQRETACVRGVEKILYHLKWLKNEVKSFYCSHTHSICCARDSLYLRTFFITFCGQLSFARRLRMSVKRVENNPIHLVDVPKAFSLSLLHVHTVFPRLKFNEIIKTACKSCIIAFVLKLREEVRETTL